MSKLEEFAKFLGVEVNQFSKLSWNESSLKEELWEKGFLPKEVIGVDDILGVSFSYVKDNVIEVSVRCYKYDTYEQVAEGVYARQRNIDYIIEFDYTKVVLNGIYIS